MKKCSTKNKYISKDWPGKLYPKIDLFDDNGNYIATTQAYSTVKDAIKGSRINGYSVASGSFQDK